MKFLNLTDFRRVY